MHTAKSICVCIRFIHPSSWSFYRRYNASPVSFSDTDHNLAAVTSSCAAEDGVFKAQSLEKEVQLYA